MSDTDTGIAKIFMHGRSQAVRLPLAFRLPGDRVRVRRVETGILLEPMVTDIDAWFAELDRFADVPFMEDGRRQPPMPEARGPVRVSYLLDTNAVIALLKNEPPIFRKRLRRTVSKGAAIAVSSIVLYELWYGVARSARRRENAERLRVFLSGGVAVNAFDEEDAMTAGDLRATLEAAGTPIGPYDLLIAAQALRSNATLVTANVSELGRVPGLQWQDWIAKA